MMGNWDDIPIPFFTASGWGLGASGWGLGASGWGSGVLGPVNSSIKYNNL